MVKRAFSVLLKIQLFNMAETLFWQNHGYKAGKALRENLQCDFLIVGAGITGISLAYFLHKKGIRNVVVIDKDFVGSGATGRAAGILVPNTEIDLETLAKRHGKKLASSYWKSLVNGLGTIKNIIKENKIECDLEEIPAIYGELKYKNHNHAKSEYNSHKSLGFNVKLLNQESLKKEIKTNLFKNALYSKFGLSINPLKYAQNLSMALKRKGIQIYENTELISLTDNFAITPHATIKFNKVIFAVDSFSSDKDIIPIKSTIAISQKLTKRQLKSIGFSKNKLVWDSKNDYHYLKLTKDKRLLVGFGGIVIKKNENKNSLYKKHIKKIKKFVKKLFPNLKFEVKYAWSGTFGITEDLTPKIAISGNTIKLLAPSGQLPATIYSKYVVDKLFNKKSSLDKFLLGKKDETIFTMLGSPKLSLYYRYLKKILLNNLFKEKFDERIFSGNN